MQAVIVEAQLGANARGQCASSYAQCSQQAKKKRYDIGSVGAQAALWFQKGAAACVTAAGAIPYYPADECFLYFIAPIAPIARLACTLVG